MAQGTQERNPDKGDAGKVVSFRLDPQRRRDLDALASMGGISKNEVIRVLIDGVDFNEWRSREPVPNP